MLIYVPRSYAEITRAAEIKDVIIREMTTVTQSDLQEALTERLAMRPQRGAIQRK